MKKVLLRVVFYFLLLSIPSFCFSQNAMIDSLQQLIKTDKTDTTKLKHFAQLSREYYSIGEYDSAIFFANNIIKLKAEIVEQSTDAKIKLSAQKSEADAYINIGLVSASKGDYSEALKNYFNSLKISEAIGYKKGKAGSHLNIGNIYSDKGIYPEALKNDLIALKIYEEIGDKKGKASSYSNIGIIYKEQRNYAEALKNHFASLKIKEEIGNKRGIATSYNNIAIVYYHLNNYDEALKYSFESLKINEALGNVEGLASSYTAIANAYASQGNYSEALKNYYAALDINKTLKNKTRMAISYSNIGTLCMLLKKNDEAEEYLNKAIELSKIAGNNDCLRNTYFSFSKLDSARGNFKEAFKNQKLYILYKDSLDNEESRKKTVQTQMTFDFEKQQAVAEAEHKKELENQEALAEEKSRKQTIIIIFVLGGLAIVLVFTALILRSLQITKKQKKIIEDQKEKVEIQNTEITIQKQLVEEKNHEISSSISYAKRIQRSFLTATSVIQRHFPEHFVLYKPRDVVSGDFYWMHQRGDYSYFCVADCTGHGIPGAFMSLIGMGVLNEIVYSKKIVDTNDILNELRRIVIMAVNPEDAVEEGKDGMDLIYLRFHAPTKQLQYSAANNSFYICRKGELLEFKPDKMPVGSFGEYEKPFTQRTVQLEDNDIIYAITDGYADQFGGPKGKKFKYKQLEDILVANSNKPMQEQSEVLNKRFTDWQGTLEQVDDVTIIGIKI
ncbi:MAG: tetratricopeptide repeat protein [Bacteroidota bacterium]